MRLSRASTEQLRRHGVGAVRLVKTCLVSRIFVSGESRQHVLTLDILQIVKQVNCIISKMELSF